MKVVYKVSINVNVHVGLIRILFYTKTRLQLQFNFYYAGLIYINYMIAVHSKYMIRSKILSYVQQTRTVTRAFELPTEFLHISYFNVCGGK